MIDCSGTYGNPNLLGDGGIPAPGERALEDRIVRYLPSFDDGFWDGADVLLTGCGHSAQTAARSLAGCPTPRSSGRCAARRPTGARWRTTRCPSARR